MRNHMCFHEKWIKKWSIYYWNSQNTLTVRWVVISTLYQRVYKSITSMLSHFKYKLFWNKVHTTYRTFLSVGKRLERGLYVGLRSWVYSDSWNTWVLPIIIIIWINIINLNMISFQLCISKTQLANWKMGGTHASGVHNHPPKVQKMLMP